MGEMLNRRSEYFFSTILLSIPLPVSSLVGFAAPRVPDWLPSQHHTHTRRLWAERRSKSQRWWRITTISFTLGHRNYEFCINYMFSGFHWINRYLQHFSSVGRMTNVNSQNEMSLMFNGESHRHRQSFGHSLARALFLSLCLSHNHSHSYLYIIGI